MFFPCYAVSMLALHISYNIVHNTTPTSSSIVNNVILAEAETQNIKPSIESSLSSFRLV